MGSPQKRGSTAGVKAYLTRPPAAPEWVCNDLVTQTVHTVLTEWKGRTRASTSLKLKGVKEARREFENLIRHMWSPTTLQGRQRLWKRLVQWLERERLPLTGDNAALFITATGASPQGKLQYAKSLSAVFGKLKMDQRALLALAASLRAAGAAVPIAQARPMTKTQMKQFIARESGEGGNPPRMENLVAMARSQVGAEAEHPEDEPNRNSSGLGATAERSQGKPIHSVEVRSHQGRRNRQAVQPSEEEPEQKGATVIIGSVEVQQEASSGVDFEESQKRSCNASDGAGNPNRGGSDADRSVGEAQNAGAAIDGNAALRRQSVSDGADPAHSRDDKAALRKKIEDQLFWHYLEGGTSQLRLGRKSKKVRTPISPLEWAAPLHCHRPTLVIERVLEIMEPKMAKRFRTLYRGLAHSQRKTPYPTGITKADADSYINGGAARLASDLPTTGYVKLLHVVEEKVAEKKEATKEEVAAAVSLRRRLCKYCKRTNKWFMATFGSEINLGHPSQFLNDLFFECATIRDGHGGFANIPLTDEIAAAMRFFDEAGRLLEPTHLPAGHSASPELCHIIFSTLAGVPGYAKQSLSDKLNAKVSVRVWIDDIRVAHPKHLADKVAQHFEDMSKLCGVAWKPSTMVNAKEEYTFLGLVWNHKRKTVSLADKTRIKILDAYHSILDGTATYADIESFSGRLIFATGALQILMPRFYRCMKATRACLRRAQDPKDLAEVPRWLQWMYYHWVYTVLSEPPPHKPLPGKQEAWLFTDASLQGWGAIFVTDDGRFYVVGGKWDKQYEPGDISALEATAIAEALKKLRESLIDMKMATIHIVVDNTAVQAAMRRGTARSLAVSDAVLPALIELKELGTAFTIQYLASKRNPADEVSRGEEIDVEKLSVEVGLLREGGKGGRCRTSPPMTTTQRNHRRYDSAYHARAVA